MGVACAVRDPLARGLSAGAQAVSQVGTLRGPNFAAGVARAVRARVRATASVHAMGPTEAAGIRWDSKSTKIRRAHHWAN